MLEHDFAGKMCLLDSGMRADIEGNDLQLTQGSQGGDCFFLHQIVLVKEKK